MVGCLPEFNNIKFPHSDTARSIPWRLKNNQSHCFGNGEHSPAVPKKQFGFLGWVFGELRHFSYTRYIVAHGDWRNAMKHYHLQRHPFWLFFLGIRRNIYETENEK